MEKKIDWDSIPSLEGLEVDWEYNARKDQDKRVYVRLNLEDIGQLFEVREIKVKVATAQQVYDATLSDISTGGVALILAVSLQLNQPLKLGFVLSSMRIVTKGIVRHIQPLKNGCKVGIQFIDLDTEAQDFIGGLYASKILRHNY